VLEPHLRPEVADGFMEHGTPILRREALYQSENKDAHALPTYSNCQWLFGPIPVVTNG
jgi:hypothetical protein